MNMTRRDFGKYSGTGLLALASGASLSLTGCTVFDSILTWVPVGLTAIQGIVTILGPLIGPGAMTIVTLIKAAFADLSAALTQYKNDTNPADKATLLAKIRTLLGDIVNHFQDFLNALNLGNNTIITIALGLVNIVIAAIEGFMNQLPAAGRSVLMTTLHAGGRTVTVTPKFYKNVNAFKKDYNFYASANGHSEVIIH